MLSMPLRRYFAASAATLLLIYAMPLHAATIRHVYAAFAMPFFRHHTPYYFALLQLPLRLFTVYYDTGRRHRQACCILITPPFSPIFRHTALRRLRFMMLRAAALI